MRWPSQIQRFWSKVITKTNCCWLWSGRKTSSGYGRLMWDGREIGAHQISWIIHNGPIPHGLWILHKCDNPSCTNPDHLFAGTHSDNMKDAIVKGRFKFNRKRKFGEDNASHKLSKEQVNEIKILVGNGLTHQHVANGFGVHQSTVTRIVNGEKRTMG